MRNYVRNGLVGLGIIGTSLFGLGCGGSTDESISDVYNVQSSTVASNFDGIATEFVIDSSGSMGEKVAGNVKIDSVKKALNEIFGDYESYSKDHEVMVGVLYMPNGDVRTLVPMGKFNRSDLESKIKNLETSEGTPLGISLAHAERDLDRTGYGNKNIVLLTDGANTVGKNPIEVYKSLIESNGNDVPTNLYVIAFDVNPYTFDGLKKLGATIYSAKDGKELSAVLKENTKLILEAPLPADYKPIESKSN
ncbi:MAG: VWA domain-containing protein [Nanoarchaeota archaeon]